MVALKSQNDTRSVSRLSRLKSSSVVSQSAEQMQRPKKRNSILRKIKYFLRDLLIVVSKIFPVVMQHKIYRYFIRLPHDITSAYTFCEARTVEDFAAAAKIVQDRYVKLNILKENQSGLRLNIYLALPTTTTLVAKHNGRVVGTVSLVRDSQFGLPMEDAFDLSGLKASGDRLCEISSLAVLEDFAGDKSVSFGLFKYLFQYSSRNQGIDRYVICVHPKTQRFYGATFGFSMANKDAAVVDDYLGGASAIAMTWDVRKEVCVPLLSRLFEGSPKSKNVKDFLLSEMPNAHLPLVPYYATEHQPLPTDDLIQTFVNKEPVFKTLSSHQIEILREIYAGTNVPDYLPKSVADGSEGGQLVQLKRQREPRYRVDCPVRVWGNGSIFVGRLFNVSDSGGLIKLRQEDIDGLGDDIRAVADVGPGRSIQIQGKRVRLNANGLLAIQIQSGSAAWIDFIQYLRDHKNALAVKAPAAQRRRAF